MNLPFTATEFLALFARYNEAIWPAQIIGIVLGVIAVACALKPARYTSLVISTILACFWLWNGLIYHLGFFQQINPVATLFGALFIVQGLLFLWAGVARAGLSFEVGRGWQAVAGGLFVLYALVAYPLVGAIVGHAYPQAPMFGVAPCPTTIFTLGLLLWTRPPLARYLIIVPLIWSLIGLSAALSLGITEDLGLLVAGLGSVAQLARRRHHATRSRGSSASYA